MAGKKQERSTNSLFVVAFLGSLDDLTLFVPMLVGQAMNWLELREYLVWVLVLVVCACVRARERSSSNRNLLTLHFIFNVILKRCSHRRCCRSDDNRSRVYVLGDVQAGGPNFGIYSFICHRSLVRKYPPHQRALYNVIAHSLSTLRKKSMRGLWWTAGNSRWTSRYSRKARRRHQRRVRRFLTDFLCMFLWMEEEGAPAGTRGEWALYML